MIIVSIAFVMIFTVTVIHYTFIELKRKSKIKNYLVAFGLIEGLAITGAVAALQHYLSGL